MAQIALNLNRFLKVQDTVNFLKYFILLTNT